MIDVVAAVIVKDNKFLITRRAPKLKLEGMWEFPGGKVEQEETPEEAYGVFCHSDFRRNKAKCP